MKAAVVTTFKQPLEVKQVEIPKPGVNDVLVKMISCGVCHTDLHAANGGLLNGIVLESAQSLFIFDQIGISSLNYPVFLGMKGSVRSSN